jgi:hypothetical protein
MGANTIPIFPATPLVSWNTAALNTANTALDGTGGAILIFEAGVNGAKIDQIRVWHLGVNVATVLRLFVNNGSTPTDAANNTLVYEETIAANAGLSQVAKSVAYDLTMIKNTVETQPVIPYLQPAGRIYATVGTTIAAGLKVAIWGANY